MSSIFSLSVSSRHSAEKRNPEKSHSVASFVFSPGFFAWIPRPDAVQCVPSGCLLDSASWRGMTVTDRLDFHRMCTQGAMTTCH